MKERPNDLSPEAASPASGAEQAEQSEQAARPDLLSRRAALQGLGLGAVAVACGSEVDGIPPAQAGTGPGTETPPAGSSTTEPGTPSAPGTGDPIDPPAPPTLSPKELLAGIEHIVVLMMENRSFDHFLGALSSDAGYVNKATVDGLTGTESNPAPNGSKVTVFKMANFTPEDPPHGWDAAHAQFNNGKNDGFVKEHEGSSQDEAMGFHDRSQIPLYYWFADNFTVCDRWFSSVMGPTWPNRYYLHATTSKGKKNNTPPLVPPKTIWDELKNKKVSAKNYVAGAVSWATGGLPTKVLGISARMDQFFDAAKDGTLPSFSLIDPDFQASDDHPSHNILRGQAFVASVYKALAESPLWPKTLLIVTYDENGGFYDHVPPPKTVDDDKEFEQLGFRVPAFVIGPTVKKGYVSKTQLEHSSVAATLKTRWDIGSLSKRMDATKDISDCIDAMKLKAPVAPPMGMPQVAMTLQSALYDGVGPSSQPMLEEMLANGTISPIDTRNHQARIGSWLEHAVRLGAVRIVGG
ncbi:MAG: hypothetical protein BGO98_29400 [Myxococcales bacterium 68-20]|nr:MAG: hypothetical protein BGO98_29400 [Myxococcales bacterium 68-20]